MTYSIGLMSDLHVEHYRHKAGIFSDAMRKKFERCDLVLLAGDNHKGGVPLLDFIDRTFPHQDVVFHNGNHEYYGSKFNDILAHTKKLVAARYQDKRVQFLNPGTAFFNDNQIQVISATLWTDFALYGQHAVGAAMGEAQLCMNDFRIIYNDENRPLTPEFVLAQHEKERRFILDQLAQPFSGKRIVMTHHAPSPSATPPQFAGSALNPAFVSDMDDIIAAHHIDYWISGHTHHNFECELHDTILISAQGGYPGERMDWQANKDRLPGRIISFD